jgi:hypothetical protein
MAPCVLVKALWTKLLAGTVFFSPGIAANSIVIYKYLLYCECTAKAVLPRRSR